MSSRTLTVMVCDDVRQEVQNKFSLMGCYGTSMWISQFPSVLPKLCMLVQFITPLLKPVSNLTIRVKKDDELIAEQVHADIRLPTQAPSWATRHVINALFVLSPFPVERPCSLMFEAVADDETIRAGTFRIDPFPAPPVEVAH